MNFIQATLILVGHFLIRTFLSSIFIGTLVWLIYPQSFPIMIQEVPRFIPWWTSVSIVWLINVITKPFILESKVIFKHENKSESN